MIAIGIVSIIVLLVLGLWLKAAVDRDEGYYQAGSHLDQRHWDEIHADVDYYQRKD